MSNPTNFQERLYKTAKNPRKAMNVALGFISLDYWTRYFDVTQNEISDRIKATLNPTNPLLSELSESKVDFYGPFWICAVLVFVNSVAGNLFHTLHVLL